MVFVTCLTFHRDTPRPCWKIIWDFCPLPWLNEDYWIKLMGTNGSKERWLPVEGESKFIHLKNAKFLTIFLWVRPTHSKNSVVAPRFCVDLECSIITWLEFSVAISNSRWALCDAIITYPQPSGLPRIVDFLLIYYYDLSLIIKFFNWWITM